MRTWRLGCDIGGTFTDFVLLDEQTGVFTVEKVLTTPADPSAAVDEGIGRLLARHPGFVAATEHVIHGTTLVINAVIEKKGARTALVATRGFSDILAMRREIRYDIYDIGAVYPTPLVERDVRREVTERVRSDGTVLTPLDETDVRRVLADLASEGVESVAVCFLHAYANPDHERRVERLAAEAHPGLVVSLSSEVLPEIKEFERMATTAVNAYVKPLVARYLARLEERLTARGMGRRLFLMLSSGGITGTATSAKFPVRLIESGPVGGALAAVHLGRCAGLGDVLSFDMGGTTAKAALIRGGKLPMTTELEVDRVHRFKRGSVRFRTSLVYYLVEAIFGALAQAIPDKVMAPSGTYPLWVQNFAGRFDDGAPYVMHFNAQGGTGARRDRDGTSTLVFPANVSSTSIERLEVESPLLCEKKAFVRDSGGPGRYRGGLGQEIVIRNVARNVARVSLIGGRYHEGAPGLDGGRPGGTGAVSVNGGPSLGRSPRVLLASGDTVRMRYPGGGGFGDPRTRPPELVLADVRRGFVSRERAREDYGVAIRSDSLEIDREETARLRA